MILELKDKITKVLLDKGLLKEDDLKTALIKQKEKGGSLSDVLVELGFVTRSDLMIALSHGLGIPPMNLSRYKIDPSVIKLISRKIAKNYKILPISKIGNTLMVAVADPLNIFLLDDIKTLTGFKISPVIATEKDIGEAQRQYYDENAYEAIEKIVGGMKEASDIKLLEDEEDSSSQSSSEILKITQDAPVVKITNLLLAEAVNLRSSDILVEPLENELRVRYRVDGILREGRRSPIGLHNAIISRLKVIR